MEHDVVTLSEPVICVECGRRLRGVPRFSGEFSIRRHKRPDGTACTGYLRVGHRPAPARRRNRPEQENQ